MNVQGIVFRLALSSLRNRRLTVVLTMVSIAVSVALLVGVERVRTAARDSFANTVSGTDLIVGARSGPLQLLLYSVFHIGNPTNNVSWQSYRAIAANPMVDWTIPLSLGDSHRGFRVLGTNLDYFAHYRFARDRPLQFAAGGAFDNAYEAVVGAEVAAALDYVVGDDIVVAHGLGETSFVHHDEQPFRVAGVLARTGTAVDRTVHISLAGMQAIHTPGAPDLEALPVQAISAFLVGLHSKVALFSLHRLVNEYVDEPLTAVIPGIALEQLWALVAGLETTLLTISALVVLAGLMALLVAILTSLNERRREMAILRAIGARPWQIFVLLVSEAAITAAVAALAGIATVYGALALAGPLFERHLGIYLAPALPGLFECAIVVMVVVLAALLAMGPAWRAYRNSLADGMTVRV